MDTGGIAAHLVDIAMTVLGSAILGLVGFVWRVSHRVTALSNRIETLREMQLRDKRELTKDIDLIMTNVDKNRDWTTNRMMSIVRDVKDTK